MGKKKKEGKQPSQDKEIEGKLLLGKPKFKKLENGRYKCVETGHELPADARDTYAQTKHCRLGLIDSALALNKPPLNMFRQDPLSRSRLICKLTGHTVNKIEEHIWKHITGRRFLNMLEKEEDEAGKEPSNGPMKVMEQVDEQISEKDLKSKTNNAKKKKKKKKQEDDVSKIISEVRNPEEKETDTEEDDFWMPPAGKRWDFDNGKDRWGSESESELESDLNPESNDANETDATAKESNNDAQELSKRTKRMSIEIGPSGLASRKKKKKKIQST